MVTSLSVYQRALSVSGSLRDANGYPAQPVPVKIYVNGALFAVVSTDSAGNYSYYTTSGPRVTGAYTVTASFEGASNYGASQANKTVYV